MLDLIVRNATLADGRRGIDVGVQAGRIEAVEPHLATRLKVIRRGKVIAETPMQRSGLALAGRPGEVSFSWPPTKS
jgi:hypothetical protein